MEEPVATYRRTGQIRAVSITDADLEELQQVVVGDIGADESLHLVIKSEEGDKTIEAHDATHFVEQLKGTRPPNSIEISFFIHSKSRNFDITKYVSIDLDRRNGGLGSRFYISTSDQTWCYGKSQVLVAFLRQKRVWYWGIAGWGLWGALCAIIGGQLEIFLSLLAKHGSTSRVLVSAFSLLVSIVIAWLAERGTLFPGFTFSRAAAPKPSLMKNQAFWFGFFGGAELLVTLAGFIWQLLH